MSIVLDQISKRFGSHSVVQRVSLEIASGELFVLLGGSGSGKSTLLRIIAGLLSPNEGRVAIGGVDVTQLPPQKRDVGFVFQNYAVFRHMSVGENIEFGLRVRGVARAQCIERRDELLDLVGLTGLAHRRPHQLSGGQLQRVALARALAYRPTVLLLDEPFGALDLQVRTQLRRSLRSIQDELGITTVLVTHDQEEAFELGDRVGVLYRGGLVEVGDPMSLYHRPHTDHVASFIGGGNVLVGRKVGPLIQLGNVQIPMPQQAKVHQEGAPVRVLFRPEDVTLSDAPPRDAVQLGQGVIVESTFAGSVSRVRVEVEGLRGARSLAPYPTYGQKAPHVEVTFPSAAQMPHLQESCFLSLNRYHVLDPHGLSVLSLVGRHAEVDAALRVGAVVARASHGTLYTFKEAMRGDSERVRKELRLGAEQILPAAQVETIVRDGEVVESFVDEAQRGLYDLAVLGREGDGAFEPQVLRSLSIRLLRMVGIPVVLAHPTTTKIGRMLICTAAGEPGKGDVLFGARLARHFRAHVTVIHVQRFGATPLDVSRAKKHLESAAQSLAAMGIEHEVMVKTGDVAMALRDTVARGKYDLVLFGASGSASRRALLFLEDLIRGANTSVAVIPMMG